MCKPCVGAKLVLRFQALITHAFLDRSIPFLYHISACTSGSICRILFISRFGAIVSHFVRGDILYNHPVYITDVGMCYVYVYVYITNVWMCYIYVYVYITDLGMCYVYVYVYITDVGMCYIYVYVYITDVGMCYVYVCVYITDVGMCYVMHMYALRIWGCAMLCICMHYGFGDVLCYAYVCIHYGCGDVLCYAYVYITDVGIVLHMDIKFVLFEATANDSYST